MKVRVDYLAYGRSPRSVIDAMQYITGNESRARNVPSLSFEDTILDIAYNLPLLDLHILCNIQKRLSWLFSDLQLNSV